MNAFPLSICLRRIFFAAEDCWLNSDERFSNHADGSVPRNARGWFGVLREGRPKPEKPIGVRCSAIFQSAT